jgi:hypothetical protein
VGLREVLADLDVRVRGAGAVDAANRELDRYVAQLSPAATRIETLRVRQQEASEMASRLAAALRQLQQAEGAQASEIEAMRRAQIRATETARQYGAEVAKLEREQREAAEASTRVTTTMTGSSVAMAGVAAAAYAAARAARFVADELGAVIEQGAGLERAAQRVGTSARELERWRYVGARAGLTTEQLDHALLTFNRTAGQASQGTGEAIRSFWRLGIRLRDTDGRVRDSGETFRETIQRLREIPHPMTRAAVASRIFGESAAQLNPLLEMGQEELARTLTRFDELGGGIGNAGAEALAASQAITDYQTASTSLRGRLAVSVLPVLTRVIETLATGAGAFSRLVETSSLAQTALGGVAVAGTIAGAAMLSVSWPFLTVAALLGLLFLAAEDVVTAFRGGDSVFGAVTERMLEMGGVTMTFVGTVENATVTWVEFVALVREGAAEVLEALVRLQRASGMELSASLVGDARDARIAAGRAQLDAMSERARFGEREAIRLSAREVGGTPAVPAQGGARSGAGGTSVRTREVHAPITIVGARDEGAVAREVRRELERRMRDEVDDEPLAPEPA